MFLLAAELKHFFYLHVLFEAFIVASLMEATLPAQQVQYVRKVN